MSTYQELRINRTQLDDCQSHRRELAVELDEGQVLLGVELFAFTANNISYAALGDAMGYWRFFPTVEGQGLIPVWGFAVVLQSHCEGVAEGERFYGYYPMASHVVMEPGRVDAQGFTDTIAHRQGLPAIYNHYLNCATDPLYSDDSEAPQMLLRPLFTTAFLLDEFVAGNQAFGARQVIITSASSKTAISLAYLLSRHRAERGQDYEVIGLSSTTNRAFAAGLGCYDRVLEYGEVESLAGDVPSMVIDLAGNSQLLARLHGHLQAALRYSCQVGASHWDQRQALPNGLPGPKPVFFFAPNEGKRLHQLWGSEAFARTLAERWQAFSGFARSWLIFEYGHGAEVVRERYLAALQGQLEPQVGVVLSLAE